MRLLRALNFGLLLLIIVSTAGCTISIRRSPNPEKLRVNKSALKKHITAQRAEAAKFKVVEHIGLLRSFEENDSDKLRPDLVQLLRIVQSILTQANGALPAIIAASDSLEWNAKNSMALLNKTQLEIITDEASEAAAYRPTTEGVTPKIILTTGLVRAVGAARELESPDEFFASLLARVDELDEKDVLEAGRIALDIEEQKFAWAHAQFEYMNALLFIIAHETAHLLFDNVAEKYSTESELRADLLAIMVTEITGRQNLETEIANRDFEEDLSFHTSDVGTTLALTTKPGFDTFLSVYRDSPYSEGDDFHLPIEERIKLLESAFEQIGAAIKENMEVKQ